MPSARESHRRHLCGERHDLTSTCNSPRPRCCVGNFRANSETSRCLRRLSQCEAHPPGPANWVTASPYLGYHRGQKPVLRPPQTLLRLLPLRGGEDSCHSVTPVVRGKRGHSGSTQPWKSCFRAPGSPPLRCRAEAQGCEAGRCQEVVEGTSHSPEEPGTGVSSELSHPPRQPRRPRPREGAANWTSPLQ